MNDSSLKLSSGQRSNLLHSPALLLAGLILAIGGTGCASVASRGAAREAQPLPSEIHDYYRFEPVAGATVREVEHRNQYVVREVNLVVPAIAAATRKEAETEPIRISWYSPRLTMDCPLILVSPIMGSNAMFVRGFARLFAANGYHAAIVHRPKLRYDARAPISQTEGYLRGAVIRNRQALDWLLTQPHVDHDRIATFGISYGGIINAATSGVEPRAHYHIFALAGAPLADVIPTSAERSIRRYWQDTLATQEMTAEQLQEELRATIRSDPVLLAPYVNRDNVMMIIAMRDRSVGTENSLKLWRSLGQPDATFVPFGHYTSMLCMPYFRFRVMKFFREKLGAPPVQGNRGYIVQQTTPATTLSRETPASPVYSTLPVDSGKQLASDETSSGNLGQRPTRRR